MTTRILFVLLSSVVAMIASSSAPFAARPITATPAMQDEPPASDTDAVKLNERERAFKTMLTSAELVGHFTLDGADKGDGQPLHEERYSITAVTKIAKNRWRFDCRIRYGKNDVAVPIILHVAWAGDTPVIGVTKMMIPGLGRYSARVLMYNNKYAGTWSGDGYGGHLFGRIERAKDATDETPEPTTPD